jgi:hypothetical protein
MIDDDDDNPFYDLYQSHLAGDGNDDLTANGQSGPGDSQNDEEGPDSTLPGANARGDGLTGFGGFHDAPVERQALAPLQATGDQATSVLGHAINGGSDFGNTLRTIPLVGGILGNIGDVAEGAGHFLTGNFSSGAREMAGGVGGLGQIGLADAMALGTGALGKVRVTGVDLANVLSGGTLEMPDHSTVGSKISDPTELPGAIGRFVYDLAIPTYGLYSGANWGSTQLGDHGPFFNQADDAARVHDAHLYDREWIENNYSPAPSGIIPSGPGGIANFLLGAIPFWLQNDNEKANPAVTMTK